MVDSIPFTQEGFDTLTKELGELKSKERPKVISDIAEARAHGDLSENAEYDAAKNEQALLEKRIAELDDKLSKATILDDDAIDDSKVYLGATVSIRDLTNERDLKYMLVNKEEANFSEGKISIDSPVGKALVGKEEGEEVDIVIPAGTLRYKIVTIER